MNLINLNYLLVHLVMTLCGISHIYALYIKPAPNSVISGLFAKHMFNYQKYYPPTQVSAVISNKEIREDFQNQLATEMQQLYLETIANEQDTEETLLTRRMRHKRYTSYITLCHFKICNMGKRRTTRLYKVINNLRKQPADSKLKRR